MILAALLLQAAVVAPAPAPMPPTDWSTLPPLHYVTDPTDAANPAAYVRDEVKAGRCGHAVATATGWALTVDLAVLASPAGSPRRVVPRAINCPSVEQYAAGIVSRRALANVDIGEAKADGWYRTSVTFTWPD